MGHHVGRAAREKHRHISDQLGLGNFAENVRCNFEAVCTDGTRGSKHGVAILFDDAGNGARGEVADVELGQARQEESLLPHATQPSPLLEHLEESKGDDVDARTSGDVLMSRK